MSKTIMVEFEVNAKTTRQQLYDWLRIQQEYLTDPYDRRIPKIYGINIVNKKHSRTFSVKQK